jgi:hypothetical protein
MRVFHRVPSSHPLPMQVCETSRLLNVYYSKHTAYSRKRSVPMPEAVPAHHFRTT